MTAEERELCRRAEELAARSRQRGIYTRTAFLTEGEQETLRFCPLSPKPTFVGGYEEAQRCVAVFGNEEEMGYPWEGELAFLVIAPKDAKFAEELNHRDYLGAILNLGIKRELLGDLLVWENKGILVSLSSIAPYIKENLERVRHTAVKVTETDAVPSEVVTLFEDKSVVCASARVDAVIAALWHLSRADGKALVEKEKVSVRGRLCTDPARFLQEGERVSVRGYGKFLFVSMEGTTGSGRSRVKLQIYR